MNRKHRPIEAAVALAALLTLLADLVALGGCRADAHAVAEARRATPVRVHTLIAAAPSIGARYTASIEPVEQVSVAFNVGGYVTEIARVTDAGGAERALRIGDAVKRGQVLARLRERDYVDRLHQAAAEVGQAEAALAKAEKDWARAEALYGSQSLTRPEHDAAEASVRSARAALAGGRARQAEVATGLADTTLAAPIDGVIVKRNVEVGTLASPGAAAFVIANLTHVKAVFGVPDGSLPALTLGGTLAVTPEALGGRVLEGRVTAISPAASATSRVFDVEVDLANADGALRSGMIASLVVPRVTGAAAREAAAVVVPLAAVVRSRANPAGYAAYVVGGAPGALTVRLTDFTAGGLAGNGVIATTGLAAGERVVVTGATLVSDGAAVEIVS